jgi:hypothetical protein
MLYLVERQHASATALTLLQLVKTFAVLAVHPSWQHLPAAASSGCGDKEAVEVLQA